MTKPYNNEMRLAVFENTKRTTDKQPTHRATFELAGVKYRASLWLKNGVMAGPIELDTYEPKASPTAAREGFQAIKQAVNPPDKSDDVPF